MDTASPLAKHVKLRYRAYQTPGRRVNHLTRIFRAKKKGDSFAPHYSQSK